MVYSSYITYDADSVPFFIHLSSILHTEHNYLIEFPLHPGEDVAGDVVRDVPQRHQGRRGRGGGPAVRHGTQICIPISRISLGFANFYGASIYVFCCDVLVSTNKQ